MLLQKLDNPTWHSLSEQHSRFALDYDGIMFYDPMYCPFGAYSAIESSKIGMNTYAKLTTDFYIVGEKPKFSDDILLKKALICNQMLLEKPIDIEIKEEIVAIKTKQQKAALFELVNLVQPGYFRAKTSDLGDYFGIYQDKKLVAVTGERMKMNDYSEVSAVVTHPDYLSKGFAKQLVANTSNKIFSESKIPYLHVADTNLSAIQLYEKLGFQIRRKITFWHFEAKY